MRATAPVSQPLNTRKIPGRWTPAFLHSASQAPGPVVRFAGRCKSKSRPVFRFAGALASEHARGITTMGVCGKRSRVYRLRKRLAIAGANRLHFHAHRERSRRGAAQSRPWTSAEHFSRWRPSQLQHMRRKGRGRRAAAHRHDAKRDESVRGGHHGDFAVVRDYSIS